jgi:site-specific DNA recombinase
MTQRALTTRAAGYLRISSEEAALEGYGLAAQENAVRGYCEARAFELIGVYVDAGISGGSRDGRAQLAALMKDAEDGSFDCLVIWRLDRLSRSNRDLANLLYELENAHVGIISIQENFDTTSAAGKAMVGIMGVFAQFELDSIR